MKKLLGLLLFLPTAVNAVPVVPNFQSGSMTSHTETTTKVTEIINSIDYQTGWEYTVTGTNIKADGATLLPPSTSVSNTMDGVTTTWSSLDANNVPNFSIKNPDQSWQFTTSLSQPGMVNQTIINRTTEMTSVTDTVSTFSQ
tara:strand:- start:1587 stop:2012 length:426 start_codon:yes stop_codon:yes gene_type:complete